MSNKVNWARGISRRVVLANLALHVLLLVGVVIAALAGYFAGAFTLGLIATAYTLGLRHAFDPDHIAAIDNTTRALQGDMSAARATGVGAESAERPAGPKEAPQSIGLFFALGHSTVVCLAAGLISASARWANLTEDSALTRGLGVWGAAFSSVTLLLLALINIVALRSLWREWSRARSSTNVVLPADGAAEPSARGSVGASGVLQAGGAADASAPRPADASAPRPADASAPRGPLARVLAPALRRVTKPWHMYPVGFLFGLGFDTATEVSLLILAASGAAFGAPWWTVMLLPLAFTAGMALMDSADGIFMARAYSWALDHPLMKLRYNILMTSISVGFALLIGISGALTLGADLGLAWLSPLTDLNLDNSGFIILGVFVALFAVARFTWRRSASTPTLANRS